MLLTLLTLCVPSLIDIYTAVCIGIAISVRGRWWFTATTITAIATILLLHSSASICSSFLSNCTFLGHISLLTGRRARARSFVSSLIASDWTERMHHHLMMVVMVMVAHVVVNTHIQSTSLQSLVAIFNSALLNFHPVLLLLISIFHWQLWKSATQSRRAVCVYADDIKWNKMTATAKCVYVKHLHSVERSKKKKQMLHKTALENFLLCAQLAICLSAVCLNWLN